MWALIVSFIYAHMMMESIERSCICGPLSFSYILWPTQDLMDSHLLPGIIWAVRQKKEEKKLRSCFLLNEFLVHDQLFLFFSFFWPLRSLGPSAYAISFLFSLRKDNERKCIQAQENTTVTLKNYCLVKIRSKKKRKDNCVHQVNERN